MQLIGTVFFLFFFINVSAQTDTIRWTQKNLLPIGLSSSQFGYFLIDSDFYVVGGWKDAPGITLSNSVWRYKIKTDTWYQMRNLPMGGAASSCSFVLNGKGYILAFNDSTTNYNCKRTVWEFNPIGDSWTRKSDFPDSARHNSSFFTNNGKGYVGQTFGCNSTDNHFWEYNPIQDQWSQIATLPAAIAAGSVAATVGNSAYLFGGWDFGGNPLQDIWHYSILNNQWDSVGQIPGLHRVYGVFWGLDSIVIGGGGTDFNTFFNDFYIYNTNTNMWKPIVFENFSDSANSGAAFIYNKTAYYFGGSTNPLGATTNIRMWSFDASKYLSDTPTGITETKNESSFTVYPNPISHDKAFSVSTSESGVICFYDALGRPLAERRLERGISSVKLDNVSEVIFYKATLRSGETKNGKIIFY